MIQGLEKLPLNAEQKKTLRITEQYYKRNGRIFFQILSYEKDVFTMKIWQAENTNKKYMSKRELIACGKDIFQPYLPENTIVNVFPITCKQDDLVNLSLADIEKGMTELGLKPKDLVKLLNIDRSTISIVLLEGRSMTKSNKAMFYYLFKYLLERKRFFLYRKGLLPESEYAEGDDEGQ